MEQRLAQLGARIRSAREIRGLSQEELAARAGINNSFLSQVERGLKAPSMRTLFVIATVLDAPASQLLAEEEEATSTLVEQEIAELLAGSTVEQQKDLLELLRVGVKLASL